MDIYNCHFSLKDGAGELEFVSDLRAFMDHLKGQGKISSWRLMRRKLGLGPPEFGEFHLMIETRDLAQLDDAFKLVSKRSGEEETLHFATNSKVRDIKFSLYRDFPDEHRQAGEELF